MRSGLPQIDHVTAAAAYDCRPALPMNPCRKHEPAGYWRKMLERGLARRADLPCPECHLSQQAIKTGRYIKLLKRPRADVPKGGIGLKITYDLQQRLEYEARPVGSAGHLAWIMMKS